jgi:hypothetical protein
MVPAHVGEGMGQRQADDTGPNDQYWSLGDHDPMLMQFVRANILREMH